MKQANMLCVSVLMLCMSGCEQPEAGRAADVEPDEGHHVTIQVKSDGYHPDRVETQAGEPVTLVFRRVEEAGCAEEVVIPSENIEKELPLNRDVAITLTPNEAGEVAFTCGMNMLKGKVVVR